MDRLEAIDRAEIADFAERQGYAWLRGLIPPEVVLALGEAADAAWRAAPGDFLALQRAVLPSAEMRRVRLYPPLLEALDAVLGELRAEQGDILRYVLPGDPPTPAHQDASYIKTRRKVWSAWIPLGDCSMTLGPLALWPGSHKLGRLPHDANGLAAEAAEAARWASADLACGDVILLDTLTAHKALPNRERRPRRSVDLRYASAG